MRIQLLLCLAILLSHLLYAQLPKGPDGNNLYKKGDCKRGGVDLNVCIYCEDKELTKNCKEYISTDNGTCTESPFKKNNDQLVRTNLDSVKYISLGKNDTTSKLPKGTKFVNGKITIQNGYKAVISPDKKIVFIMSPGSEGIRGGFRCDCDPSSGSCNASIINNKIVCGGDSCCKIVVTISDSDGLTMQQAEEKPEKLKWKKLVLSTKSN